MTERTLDIQKTLYGVGSLFARAAVFLVAFLTLAFPFVVGAVSSLVFLDGPGLVASNCAPGCQRDLVVSWIVAVVVCSINTRWPLRKLESHLLPCGHSPLDAAVALVGAIFLR